MKIKFPYTPELKKLAKALLKDGDELRLVGGCVRNFLMKRPISDFDLACKFKPEKVTKILEQNKIKVIPTGIEHGTVTAIIDKIPFEITTLRKDIQTFGRHAKVEFTTDYKKDAERRDFTMNALYLDFNGNVYDYFDGLTDIKKGIVKFINNPADRIREDYLRILRFFRFYCFYGFFLDNDALAACIKFKKKLNSLSGERIHNEMFKILNAPYPVKALKLMQNNAILQEITNGAKFDFLNLLLFSSIKTEINCDFNNIFTLALLLLSLKNPVDTLDFLRKSWKLSNKEYKETAFLLKNKISKFTKDEVKKLLFNHESKDEISNLFVLNFILKKNIDKNSLKELNSILKFIRNYKIPQLPITGSDLLNNGFTKGKNIGALLDKARKLFIKSEYKASKKFLLESLGK